jgi:hypothetical protein
LTRARLAPLVVGAVALLAAIAYAALPVVLSGIVQRALTAQGLTDVRIELGYPGRRTMFIRTVEFAGRRAAYAFNLRARDVEIEYDIAELREGRLIRVRVPDAALRLVSAPAAASTEASRATAVPLPGNWVAAFPLQEVVVERLQVNWRSSDTLAFTGYAHGQVQRQDSRLVTRLSIADEKRQLFELHLDLSAAGELNASVLTADTPAQPVVRMTAALVSHDAQTVATRGSVDVQLRPLLSMLAPWFALPQSLAQLDGRLQARWSGKGPTVLAAQGSEAVQLPRSNGTVSVDLSAVRLGKLLSDGNLHLDATLASGDSTVHWRIADSLRVSARIDPAILALMSDKIDQEVTRRTEPAVLRAPHAISGQLVVTPLEIKLTVAPRVEIMLEKLWTPDAHVSELKATLPEAVRVTYQPTTGRFATAGVALAVSAPAIDPMFASIGTIENVAVAAKIESGPLTPPPPITIDDATVTLLDGRLRARGVRYDSKSKTNHFTIDLENLDVARIVAMERQLGVEASGRLDGRLPFSVTPRGITIAGGQLRARPPGGVVRYTPNEAASAMAASNLSVKLVQDVLSNYHYAKLEADVDYSETGDLALRVAMEGQNPDWNAGQPINLNINLTENIPMLLRSLRLTGDISEQIEKRVLERSKRNR